LRPAPAHSLPSPDCFQRTRELVFMSQEGPPIFWGNLKKLPFSLESVGEGELSSRRASPSLKMNVSRSPGGISKAYMLSKRALIIRRRVSPTHPAWRSRKSCFREPRWGVEIDADVFPGVGPTARWITEWKRPPREYRECSSNTNRKDLGRAWKITP